MIQSFLDALKEGIVFIDKEKKVFLTNSKGSLFLKILSGAKEGDVLKKIGNITVNKLIRQRKPVEIEVNNKTFEIKSYKAEDGWVLVIRDITAEKEERNKLEAQERLATVGRLAAGIAHDFNNLLTPIVGYAQMYMNNEKIPKEIRDAFKSIYRQVKRASELIAQILDFSRKSVFQKQYLNLVPFMKEIVKMLRRTIKENIEIEFEFPPGEDLIIKADPTRIEQIIMNLAVNAQDAMPEGGKIRIRLFKKKIRKKDSPFPNMGGKEWVIISFKDTGSGISRDVLPHIFEPFFSTKESGTGLGLSQVYGIVKQHDGYIDVKTKEKRGTEFIIYFPLVKKAEEKEKKEETEVPEGKGETVLIIEDEKEVREIVKEVLENVNYRVITAPDGEKGLDIYSKKKDEISVVLMDMIMPKLSGNKLIEKLRKINPEVKIIAMSGYPFEKIEQDNICAYIRKPLDFSELLNEIKKITGTTRLELATSGVTGRRSNQLNYAPVRR